MVAVLHGAVQEPDPPWFLKMTMMSGDCYVVDDGGEISLLNRERLEQLLDQFLRRNR
jgi:hypothetical protein